MNQTLLITIFIFTNLGSFIIGFLNGVNYEIKKTTKILEKLVEDIERDLHNE